MADDKKGLKESVLLYLKFIFNGMKYFPTKKEKMADDRKIDSISTLPDVILQHIFCFIPTELAISTSVLSRRWRYVWCDTPSLSLNANTLVTAASINKTLTRYTAPKMMNFQLKTTMKKNIPHINRWIKFAMSQNVENLSLDISDPLDNLYKLPDFFYINSSVKQLNIKLSFSHTMVPACTVSWTSLKKLSLSCCRLFDESMAKILSGCPILENLTLYHCAELNVLDLSKSLRLRTLEVNQSFYVQGPKLQIVAPHIHCLKLLNFHQLSCTTLVDVASLTEAKLEFLNVSLDSHFKADFLQDKVLKMLEKLKNAEKLTFGGNFIQILSLAEILCVPFPMFKVKTLTLDTMIIRYVIPGIERLLQNSPDLQKLTVRAWNCNSIPEKYLDKYMKLQGFNPSTCWRSRDGVSWNKRCSAVKSKHVISIMELMLENTKKLDKMVVMLDERYLKFKIKDVVPTLSQLQQRHHCGIVLSTTKLMTSEEW